MTRLFWIAFLGLLLTPSAARAQSDEVVYYHTDAIGSVRMITNQAGVDIGRFDFTPFGQPFGTQPAETRKFAGKELDAETELDYFGARYMRAQSGRFTSVDPVMNIDAALTDPQRWNRYAYALNSPFKFVDPDGRNPIFAMLQRLSQQAAGPASRYGTAAYNWATRFFNSHFGQEVMTVAAEALAGGQLPYGFSSTTQLQSFSRTLSAGLSEVGGDGARAFLAGSAVTGANSITGAAFDVGRKSDFDVALVGQNLLSRAKELGLQLRGAGSRTGPLRSEDLKALGLDTLAQKLSGMSGRTVNFMIYGSEQHLRERGAKVLPLF